MSKEFETCAIYKTKKGDTLLIKGTWYKILVKYRQYNGKIYIVTDDGLERVFPSNYEVVVQR